MEKLQDITFYTMDKAIRTYRTFAQKRLRDEGHTITIDQWLIIKVILENPEASQQEIAEKVFKDNASVTRIIELLVKSGYLLRNTHPDDRRKTQLTVTASGRSVIEDVQAIVLRNRQQALSGISEADLKAFHSVLHTIIENCR